MKIREMKQEDWKSVNNIYSYAIKEGKSTFQEEPQSFETFDSEHIKDCRYVVEIEGKVVAWCTLSKTSNKKAYWGSVELSIYVDKEYRRKGIGKKLLEYLCMESQKLGYWSLYSVIMASNESSIMLHKKCGFRKIGCREKVAKDIFGKWQDVILMERRNDNY